MVQDEHAEHGAHRHRRLQQAETARPDKQNVLRIYRQQRRRAAQQHREHVERDGSQNDFARVNKLEPRQQRRKRHGLLGDDGVFPAHHADEQAKDQRCQRIEHINQRGGRGRVPGHGGDDGASRRRPDNTGQLEHGGIPIHGPREILPVHQRRQKGGGGRPRKRAGGAADEQADVNPVNRRLERRYDGHPKARRRHDRRHQHDDSFAVVIVRDVPGRQREQKHRNHHRQPYEAQCKSRTGALINFPADGHGEHLLAEHSHQTAGQIKCEIPVPENGIRMLVTGFYRRRRQQIFWRFSLVHKRDDGQCNTKLARVEPIGVLRLRGGENKAGQTIPRVERDTEQREPAPP